MTVYNTERTLESFQDKLDEIRMHGFNPIAVSQIKLNDVFVFETKDETDKANEKFILKRETEDYIGLFLTKDDFLNQVKEYEKEGEYSPIFQAKVRYYWLTETK